MSPLYKITDPNSAWLWLKNVLCTAFNKHAPIISKCVKGRHCPWLTAEVKTQMNIKDKLLRKVRKSNKQSDWSLYKTAKNRCNNMVKNAKRTYNRNQLTEHRNNPRSFWKAIKSVFPGTKSKSVQSSVKLLDENDTIKMTKANSFCNFFSNAAFNLKQKALPLVDFIWKSGDKESYENYRPISILPVISKIMEKAVNSQLIEYLETNNLLCKLSIRIQEKSINRTNNYYLLLLIYLASVVICSNARVAC